MYLKRLEMVGFKSFAEKTRLDFESGMTAIVGPNGCGKSNIADAIRWVLGEQSAKSLRGSKMEDCIFSGADSQKALGMAEVSLTLAECEKVLGTEYHEITVTRRVHRSGEGQYLINRSACRLKDIQRLFMDTGIGTQSYSLMEQGRIDRILSSRPEDRRSVFEEASGITKFKSDRREALRKLEQTEANLLRLADIIREVRRQIISLQRQAGKARRYKAFQEELRHHELYFTRERLAHMDSELGEIEARRAALAEREEAASSESAALEKTLEAAREELNAFGRELELAHEAIREARSRSERTREDIVRNRQRIDELKAQVQQDGCDIEKATERVTEQKTLCADLEEALVRAEAARDEASTALADLTVQLKEREDEVEEAGTRLHRLRTETLELETRVAARQKEWSDLDARERSSRLRRERLEAEQAELRRALALQEERSAALAKAIQKKSEEADACRTKHEQNVDARAKRLRAEREGQEALRPLREKAAAARSRIEWVQRQNEEAEGFPGGARLLLDNDVPDGAARSRVLGTLADLLEIEPEYQVAVEAVLRPWLDSVVVDDEKTARAALQELRRAAVGSARILTAEAENDSLAPESPPFGTWLRSRIRPKQAVRALCDRIVNGVVVVQSLDDIPESFAPGLLCVTRDGFLVSNNGHFSCWMPHSEKATPVARNILLQTWTAELNRLTTDIEGLTQEQQTLCAREADETRRLADSASHLEEALRALARVEGERAVIEQETREAKQRLETVGFEIQGMHDEGKSAAERRGELHKELDRIRARQDEVRAATGVCAERLRTAEQERSVRLGAVTDQRVREAEQRREAENLSLRLTEQRARGAELDEIIRTREERVCAQRAQIEALSRVVKQNEGQLDPNREEIHRAERRLHEIKTLHDQRRSSVAQLEQSLRTQRERGAEYQNAGAKLDIDMAQRKTRRQDIIERITQSYRIDEEALRQAPEPEWENGVRPDREATEVHVAELRAKLEAMGPVNLVAIEEHDELEKRYAFLEQQQSDLVRSKQQLLDLIRRINQTTTDLFAQTFSRVNENFGLMFTRIFGGGSAKLLMVDETEVLESGIEIIARPPGKKLQSVSLLSGGERTMTAVALLFALYMVKPSPFCLLDELDAALDDSNIGRFVDVVKDFLKQSQFIVITHNRQTISAAEALYGVTMKKQGVSSIVSVRFNREGRPETVSGAPAKPAGTMGVPTA